MTSYWAQQKVDLVVHVRVQAMGRRTSTPPPSAMAGTSWRSSVSLPRRWGLHLKDDRYYHVTSTLPMKWTHLGTDRAQARIEGTEPDSGVRTFEVIPMKAPRTQHDNFRELDNLAAVFGKVLIDAIKPFHVRQYLDTRGQTAKARANREKALLSHLFNKAREWGYTDAPNPCQGVIGLHRGRPRPLRD